MAYDSGSSISLSSSEGSQILESGTELLTLRTGVTKTTRYSDLEAQSQQNEEPNRRSPVILQQIFGPRPRWQAPVSASKVHPTIDVLYVVDTSIEFHLALVRTPTKDFPLYLPAFPLPRTSVIAAVESSLLLKQINLGSITLYEGDEDVRDMEYDLRSCHQSSSRLMVFFIVDKQVLNAWEFKERYNSYNPMPQDQGTINMPYHFKLPVLRSNILVDTAPDLPALSLPCIHLSLALRHSVISLVESVESESTTSQYGSHICARLQRSIDQLQRIFDDISEGFAGNGNWGLFMNVQDSLDRVFYSLCEEHPGAVAIRQSFDAYQNCVQLGLRACNEELGLKREDLDNYFSIRRDLLTQITDSESLVQIDSVDNENEWASGAFTIERIAYDWTSAASDSVLSLALSNISLNPDNENEWNSGAINIDRIVYDWTSAASDSVLSLALSNISLDPGHKNGRASGAFATEQAQWQVTRPQGPPWTTTIEIPRSELILRERPLITLTQDASDVDISNAVNGMSPGDFAFFNSLPIAPEFQALDPTTARFNSNSLQHGTVAIGQQDVKAYGIFPFGLGFASCCSPNVHAHWNATSRVIEYRVIRDIAVGESLSISFDLGGLLLPHNERRTRLWQRRHIVCYCLICNSPHVEISDFRRKFVAPIVQTREMNVQTVVQAVEYLKLEALYLFEDTLCYDCYLLESRADPPNIVTAKYWLFRAYKAARATAGEGDARVQYMRRLGGF